ncbi:MAG: choice-of-anchor D domain-containing protein [Myxococcales bacterium]|nr:choice-of-anchor D domain-containing protein [Myxococcales bacterium]
MPKALTYYFAVSVVFTKQQKDPAYMAEKIMPRKKTIPFQGFIIATLFSILTFSHIACMYSPVGDASIGALATNLENNQLSFSDVPVGQTETKEFLLYNKGTIAVTITGWSIDRDQYKVFSILHPPSFPLRLEPGKANGIKVTVQFLSQKKGDFSARINMVSDANNVDPDSGFFIVHLRHIDPVLKPTIDCEEGLDFGTVEKGQSKTMECTVTSHGDPDLIIKSAQYIGKKGGVLDFHILEPQLPVTLHPNRTASIKFKISYKPSDETPTEDQGEFKLFTNVTGEDDTNRTGIKVYGKTTTKKIQLVPFYGECLDNNACTQIDRGLSCQDDAFSGKKLCLPESPNDTGSLIFPLTSKGRTIVRTFAIRSTGDTALEVSKIELDGNSSVDFRIDSTLATPLKIEPKQEVLVNVEYTPSDDQQDSGTIQVESNAGNLPTASLPLQAQTEGCDIKSSPSPEKGVIFQSPISKRVFITNIGNKNCTIHKIAIEKGDLFAMLPQQPEEQILAPNRFIELLVRFSQRDVGYREDNLVVTSDDPDTPQLKLPLLGRPVEMPCNLQATPPSLIFPWTKQGQTSRRFVNITNRGAGDCIIAQADAITVKGTDPSGNTAFTLDDSNSYPMVISSGESVSIHVNYTPPQSIASYQGAMSIASNDLTNPHFKVVLSGLSGTSCLEVIPTQIDFGSSQIGCATPERELDIFNLGVQGCNSAITINKLFLANGTSSEFEIRSAPVLPKTLNPGEKTTIKLRYKPKDLDVDFGTLDIENDVQGQSPFVIPLRGNGVKTSEQKDTFRQISNPKSDTLIVIDDSCSMFEEQNNLAANFQSFISWANNTSADYSIMVTTTDTTGVPTSQCSRPAGIPGCACLGSGSSARIIHRGLLDPKATFQANVRVGTHGSSMKQGLEAAYRALSPPALTDPKCNLGFLRADAELLIIFVSDGQDNSPQPTSFYITFFRNLKGFRNLDLIRASSIVGPSPNGCNNPSNGNAQYAPRYIEVATQLNGVNESICVKDWAGTLSKIGAIAFGYRRQFFLSRRAHQASLIVKVDGKFIPQNPNDGWTYDPTTNSVFFSQGKVPPPNSLIEAQYRAVCLP